MNTIAIKSEQGRVYFGRSEAIIKELGAKLGKLGMQNLLKNVVGLV